MGAYCCKNTSPETERIYMRESMKSHHCFKEVVESMPLEINDRIESDTAKDQEIVPILISPKEHLHSDEKEVECLKSSSNTSEHTEELANNLVPYNPYENN